jgi:hypothetical protein
MNMKMQYETRVTVVNPATDEKKVIIVKVRARSEHEAREIVATYVDETYPDEDTMIGTPMLSGASRRASGGYREND